MVNLKIGDFVKAFNGMFYEQGKIINKRGNYYEVLFYGDNQPYLCTAKQLIKIN